LKRPTSEGGAMRTIEAFREAEDAEPWRRYIIQTAGDEWEASRPGVVTWEGIDPDYVRYQAGGDGSFTLIALDSVIALRFPPPRK